MLAKPIGTIVVATTACVIPWVGSAHAEIIITTASISQGELVIVGRVRRPRDPSVEIKISPNKTVRVESTSTGGFRWIGPRVSLYVHREDHLRAGYQRRCHTKLRAFPDLLDRPDRPVRQDRSGPAGSKGRIKGDGGWRWHSCQSS